MRLSPTIAFCSLLNLLSSLPTTAETSQAKDDSELLNWERLVQNGNWASVSEEYQFVRASNDPKFDGATDEAVTRFLEDANDDQSSSSNHYSQYLKTTGTGFDYSANAEYEQYQLAWRFLGLSIDCSISSSQNGGSHDDEDGEDESCTRVLLYAVYVDFDYDDNLGLEQYQFYKRKTGKWVGCNTNNYGYNANNAEEKNNYGYNANNAEENNNYGYNANNAEENNYGYNANNAEENNNYGYNANNAEENNNYGYNANNAEENNVEENNYGYRDLGGGYYNGNRCVKMDCHLQGTHYSLLGVFKALNPAEWLEQLFKHEGVCVWTESEYQMAQIVRQSLPEKCTAIGYAGDSHDSGDNNQEEENQQNTNIVGSGLYYHIKPEIGGNIALGLYNDASCSVEYSGGLSMQQVIEGNYDLCDEYYGTYNVSSAYGYGYYYSDWMKNCGKNNPAVLYRLLNDFNDALNIYKQCQSCVAYNLDEEDYQCDDDAGYTNCMQCMKFKEKANSLPAFASDLLLASRQNTLLEIDINGVRYGYGGYSSDFHVGVDGDFAYSAESDRALEAKYAKASHHGGPMGGAFYGCSIAALACSFAFFIKVKFIDDFSAKKKGNNDKRQPLLQAGPGNMS